jgi:hypothetical protein
MMALGSLDTDESVGMAHHRLELVEKGRYDYRKKKKKLSSITDLIDDMVKTIGEEESVAGMGERM